MALTMHQISVSCFTRMLDNLAAILAKAEKHANAKDIDPEELLKARLAPDMLDLTQQIQFACNNTFWFISGITGRQGPEVNTEPKSFADLQGLVQQTIEFLQGIGPEELNGTEDKQIVMKLKVDLPFTGLGSLQKFSLPNFFFHVTTAYAILRHKGVELGKADYLGDIT